MQQHGSTWHKDPPKNNFPNSLEKGLTAKFSKQRIISRIDRSLASVFPSPLSIVSQQHSAGILYFLPKAKKSCLFPGHCPQAIPCLLKKPIYRQNFFPLTISRRWGTAFWSLKKTGLMNRLHFFRACLSRLQQRLLTWKGPQETRQTPANVVAASFSNQTSNFAIVESWHPYSESQRNHRVCNSVFAHHSLKL